MNLQKIANNVVAIVNIDDPLDLAIQHMWRLNIRHVPVVRQGVAVGMVSERDVLFHVCWLDRADEAEPVGEAAAVTGATRIDQIMTSPVVTLSPDDPLEKAARLMLNKQISAVPLASESSVVGIVTEADFLKCFLDPDSLALSARSRESLVSEHMASNVFSVGPDDATLSAIRLMRDKQVHHIPVLDQDRLVGIISDRDVLRGTSSNEAKGATTTAQLQVSREPVVRGIMTPQVEVLDLSATLAQAASKMVARKIGALPVVEHDKLLGIITETDLLREFVRASELVGSASSPEDEAAK